jgi:hypothetical protein
LSPMLSHNDVSDSLIKISICLLWALLKWTFLC